MTEPYAPRPQKHRGRTALIVALAVALLAYPVFQFILFAYSGVRLYVASRAEHEVVYKVTGTAQPALIMYNRTGHGESAQVFNAKLPWQSDPIRTKGSGQVFSVRASTGATGTLHCEIWVDGALAEREKPSATGLDVDCVHRP